jgi:DNA-binding response OmpR family regulator/HPt (histidine-containing phosphotransfer) domain-containing protein
MGSQASSPDALQQVLDETRQRFVATFVARCESIRSLVDKVAALGPKGPVAALTLVTHRLSGLAGTIGFPTISARASELEDLADGAGGGAFDAVLARDAVDALREAFTKDLASPPVWAPPAISTAQGAKILVAEDESDQRAIVTTCLEEAGYAPIAVGSGDLVVDMTRAEKPALILLDIAMPRLDGYSACRLLKADPELAEIPVIFMTTGANLDDKLAGLALGADEFLIKPVDTRELVLRIQRLLARTRSRPSPKAAVPAARTVVVAEDDPDVTRIVDAQVRAAGYKAIIALDGEQALAAVRAHAPDALVLDLMMPKLNGFDVLTELRGSHAPWPQIIVLSGRGREQDVVRAFELGADDYMTKPFNPKELMARIARLLKVDAPAARGASRENRTG